MELRPHQKEAVEQSGDKQGLWFACRAGKSPTLIRLACARSESALMISSKSVVNYWNNEILIRKTGVANISFISRKRFKRDKV